MQTVIADPSASIDREYVLIDLALQGGGSHGAFTWGVLDRLLEESWLRIDGISGTSAGAMNAVVLVDGYEKDGPEGARAALEDFWRRVSHSARFSPIRRSPMDILLGRRLFGQSDHHPIGARVRIARYVAHCGQSCRTRRHATFSA